MNDYPVTDSLAKTHKYALLKKIFGYDTFRGGQEDVVDAILAGHDALAIMPTGAGKSICYQLPALLLPGITIVVSPLVSLMKDQVGALVQAGVPAAFLNNSLNDNQKQLMLQRAREGRYKIIYVAPERLMMAGFLRFAQEREISMVTVDESHCISQWGQDFRPSYLQIKAFVAALPTRPVVSAFTATATARVRSDILENLALAAPFTITTSFDRPNLYFEVLRRLPREKPDALISLIEQAKNQVGIVYCSTTKQVDETTALLQRMGYAATRYHAKLVPEERHQNQDDFLYDRANIMVATNAFGMGIDKSNVRYVVHYNMPKDFESYYQEAGRAGRDGEDARCTLLYTASDVRTAQYFIDQERNAENDIPLEVKMQAAAKAEERLKTMTFYATTKYCLRQYILRYFGEQNVPSCDNCGGCDEMQRASERAAYLAAHGDEIARNSRPYNSRMAGDGASPARPKPPARRAAAKAARQGEVELSAQDETLLEQLFVLRKRLAGKQKIPAYMVFSDATLREVCAQKPTSIEEFLNVKGVGEVKAERYGSAFVTMVRECLAD